MNSYQQDADTKRANEMVQRILSGELDLQSARSQVDPNNMELLERLEQAAQLNHSLKSAGAFDREAREASERDPVQGEDELIARAMRSFEQEEHAAARASELSGAIQGNFSPQADLELGPQTRSSSGPWRRVAFTAAAALVVAVVWVRSGDESGNSQAPGNGDLVAEAPDSEPEELDPGARIPREVTLGDSITLVDPSTEAATEDDGSIVHWKTFQWEVPTSRASSIVEFEIRVYDSSTGADLGSARTTETTWTFETTETINWPTEIEWEVAGFGADGRENCISPPLVSLRS